MVHAIGARRQFGTTLLEALVALLVLALGMLSVGRVQTQMRLNADLARQRSEAVRLAQEDLERLRAFSVLALTAGARSFAEIADAATTVDAASGYTSNTRYQVKRTVTPAPAPNAKNASVTVGWVDRAGAAHQVVLNSVISGSNPAHSGALNLVIGSPHLQGFHARAPAVPLVAKDLGNGTSVFKPVSQGSVAIVLSNLSGAVIGRCEGVDPTTPTAALTFADLGSCDAVNGHLISGYVRFSATSPPDPGAANALPLAVAVALSPSSGNYARPPACNSEAMKVVRYSRSGQLSIESVPIDASATSWGLSAWTETGDRFVAYHCTVFPAAGTTVWSGQATLVPTGWIIGAGPDDWRVCRYAADLDGSGAIDANIEHPARYGNVDSALPNQNYLVIKSSESCPAGKPVRLDGTASDIFVNWATAPHQP
jgi:Tfp pilus assembly protein PilV